MGHAAIENRTSLAFQPLFLADEEGRPLLALVVQATYEIVAGRALSLAQEQAPPIIEGVLYGADAASSSYRLEPVFAFVKPATDVVLIGHAVAPRHGATEVSVVFRAGPVRKVVRVVGDRRWVRSGGTITATAPYQFDRIPLIYERAFGGWDRGHADPSRHAFEPRNPVGTGFRSQGGVFEEGARLPNLEDPDQPLTQYGQVVPPAGFGFTSPSWQPRASFAGTYDEAWLKDRMPLLPKNFDRRFFNAAPPGLVAPGYFTGDEPVLVENASTLGRLSFRLPGARAPRCLVELRRREDVDVETKLDTVVVDTDADRVLLTYRAHVRLAESAHDVRSIVIREREEGAPSRGPGATRWARGQEPGRAW
jgi:hypothetical protein